MSVQQLQQQKAAFQQAYNSGQISQADYQVAISRQNQLIAAAQQPSPSYTRPEIQQKIAAQTPSSVNVNTPSPSYTREQIATKMASTSVPQNVQAQNQASTISYDVYYRKEVTSNALTRQVNQQNPDLLKQVPQGSLITSYNQKTQTVQYMAPSEVQSFKESVNFYNKAGYTEFAGKYAVPTNIKPEQVQSIKEVPNIGYIPNTTIPRSNSGSSLEFTLKPTAPTTEIKNSVFTGENLNFFGQQPVIKNNEQRVLALEIVGAAITAPVIGAAATVKAASIGVGITQGIKTGSVLYNAGEWNGDVSKSLLTPQEAIEGATTGIIFSGIGGAVNSKLGLTGKTVIQRSERVLVSGGLGAIGGPTSEYLHTGKVTGESVAEGALFGLGFGVAGEGLGAINSKYNVVDRVAAKGKDLYMNRNLENNIYTTKGQEVNIKINTASTIKASNNIERNPLTYSIEKTTSKPVINESTKPAEFKTSLKDNYVTNPKSPDYLVKPAELKNLTISDRINIRNPNTFDVAQANTRIDSMLNQVPSKGGYDSYQNTMSQGRTITATKTKGSSNELFKLEQLTKQPLPRTSVASEVADANLKINRYNFDAKATESKISAQLKEANTFDVNKVNSNIAKALQEAALEKASSPKFTTTIERASQNKNIDYLVKPADLKNLTISERINIRNPKTFNPSEANAKTDSMINEVPTKESYNDYRSIISQGRTLTATKTRTRIANNSLFNIEQMTRNPLPRSSSKLAKPILPNSIVNAPSSSKAIASSSYQESAQFQDFGLISKINVESNRQRVSEKMTSQFAGVDTYTRNMLNSRAKTVNSVDVASKIVDQLSGFKSKAAISQGQAGGKSSGARSQLYGTRSIVNSQLYGTKNTVNLDQGQQQKVGVTSGISINQDISQGQKITPIINPIQDIDQYIGTNTSVSNQKTKPTYTLPQFGGQYETAGGDSFRGGKKSGVKSIKFVNPIMEGEELLGF